MYLSMVGDLATQIGNYLMYNTLERDLNVNWPAALLLFKV